MGRKWNDRLKRRVGDSTCLALDEPQAGIILVTDYTDKTKQALVEILDRDQKHVIACFIVELKRKPGKLRYREPTSRWPVASDPPRAVTG